MEEHEYEAVPSTEARRLERAQYGKLLLARWATIAGMMLAGAATIAIGANLLEPRGRVAVVIPAALLAFLAGWWLRGRMRR